MIFTSDNMQRLSSGLGFLNSYNKASAARTEGEIAKTMGRIRADQLLQNARMRMNQGVREAAELRRQGEVVQSNAIAQMAASGGGIDPVMLAKIQQRADYNSMSAIYDAAQVSSKMRFDAYMSRAEGSFQAAMGRAKATDILTSAATTAIGKWPSSLPKTKPSGIGTGGTFNRVPNKRGFVGGF